MRGHHFLGAMSLTKLLAEPWLGYSSTAKHVRTVTWLWNGTVLQGKRESFQSNGGLPNRKHKTFGGYRQMPKKVGTFCLLNMLCSISRLARQCRPQDASHQPIVLHTRMVGSISLIYQPHFAPLSYQVL